MQKCIYKHNIGNYKEYIDEKVIDYVNDNQTQTYESFEKFSLMSFEWYDVDCDDITRSQILIYIDKEDVFIMYSDKRTHKMIDDIFKEDESNGRALYLFFVNLIKGDREYLEQYENDITEVEDEALISSRKDYLHKIFGYRKELLRMKRYYEQLDDIIDNLAANDNGLLSEDDIRHFTILGNRTERLRTNVINMREYVTQMREAYQSQIDIEQNNLMRIFTVITAVFLPLTLMVGWYGMNFMYMPELASPYAYPVFIIASLIISIVLIIFFKKKKWF